MGRALEFPHRRVFAGALLRIAVGLTALLAGCQPLPHPFAEDLPPPGMLTLRDTVGVTVEPVAGTPRATAAKLVPAMTKALRQHDVAASETADPAAYRLFGHIRQLPSADGEAVLVAAWELRNPKGKRIGERGTRLVAPAPDWQSGSGEAVQHLAAASATAVATLLEDKPPVEVQVGGRTRLRLAPVAGAPGNGDDVLAKAIAALLQRQDVTILTDPQAQADLELDGKVTVGKPRAGKQHVRIAWQVKRPGGSQIGTVAQENDVPAGLLDGPWGDLAYTVALAAEPGIMALIQRGAVATAGNAPH
jgi:ABC-type transport auxiliary lipoprotein component